jgi:hypothetical protein
VRTTLTLDDDVAAMLERLRKARRQSLKSLINEALRQGLKQLSSPPKRRESFRTTAVALGACRIGSIDNVAEVLALAEGDSFR